MIGYARNELSLECMAFQSWHRKAGQINTALVLVFFRSGFEAVRITALGLSDVRNHPSGGNWVIQKPSQNQGLFKVVFLRVNGEIFALEPVCSQVSEISADIYFMYIFYMDSPLSLSFLQ